VKRYGQQQSRSKSYGIVKTQNPSQSSIFLISDKGFWRFYHANRSRSSKLFLTARGHLSSPTSHRHVASWTRITKALLRPRNIVVTGALGTGAVISQVYCHYWGCGHRSCNKSGILSLLGPWSQEL
jgi:hypothetical protein